jgi:hypothetical protein
MEAEDHLTGQQEQQNGGEPNGPGSFRPYGPGGYYHEGGPYLEPHRGGLILTFGILGLVFMYCFIFGILAWVMGGNDLERMRAGEMDRAGEGLTAAGRILGIVSVVMGILVAMAYAILILMVVIGQSL